MKIIKLELTSEELQILAQALDTHVRQHGLQVAAASVVVLQKLRVAADAKPEIESNPDEGVQTDA